MLDPVLFALQVKQAQLLVSLTAWDSFNNVDYARDYRAQETT